MRHLICFASVSLLLLSACGAVHLLAVDWRDVHEQATCEALAPSSCVGAFGFTVRRDGTFLVGPAPDGSVIGGSIPSSDLARINADALALDGQNQQCDSSPTIPGVSDSVDVAVPAFTPTSPDPGILRVFDLGSTPNRTCYVGGRDQAIRLHDDLRALMARYYVTPFPGSVVP